MKIMKIRHSCIWPKSTKCKVYYISKQEVHHSISMHPLTGHTWQLYQDFDCPILSGLTFRSQQDTTQNIKIGQENKNTFATINKELGTLYS